MVNESVARVFMSVSQTTSEMLAVPQMCFSCHCESWPRTIVSHAWRSMISCSQRKLHPTTSDEALMIVFLDAQQVVKLEKSQAGRYSRACFPGGSR